MTALLPVAVYGLKVPAGDVMIPAVTDFPATFRITMAAIDPSAEPEVSGTTTDGKPPRATLKLVFDPSGPDASEDEGDEEFLQRLLAEGGDGDDDNEDLLETDSSDDDEEMNGGPSDPAKSKKARRQEAAKQILEALAADQADGSEDDEELQKMLDAPSTNGIGNGKLNKGKARATDSEDEDEDTSVSNSTDGLEEVVICTLDPEKNYQQPLDITIPEDQEAFFKVSGNFTVYLTGNYVIPDDKEPKRTIYESDEEEDDEDYLSGSEEDEMELGESESDELDDLDDPRIMEVDSEEDEAPPLVLKVEPKKGKNKRAAEESDEEPASLDDIMAKSLKPADKSADIEPKLSKKQLKKLKKNDGKAAAVAADTAATKATSDKKVSFAKNLEEGPSSSATANGDKKSTEKPKENGATTKSQVKVISGVQIDDRKGGDGRAAKKGDRVGMRYIGKLKDGKVFDSNKKGPPFKFKLGDGSVIKGWDVGVAGMKVGGERRLIIPANMAYGNKKMADIPANSELTFDVKLLEIK